MDHLRFAESSNMNSLPNKTLDQTPSSQQEGHIPWISLEVWMLGMLMVPMLLVSGIFWERYSEEQSLDVRLCKSSEECSEAILQTKLNSLQENQKRIRIGTTNAGFKMIFASRNLTREALLRAIAEHGLEIDRNSVIHSLNCHSLRESHRKSPEML